MPSPTKETLFQALPHKDKAENTNSAARAIISAEAKARDSKTARLKALRLEQERLAPPPAPKPRRAAPKRSAETPKPQKTPTRGKPVASSRP